MNDWHDFPAPAKLNLFLHVVGRRADGYHLLETVFRFLDYGDTVRLRLRADGAIRRFSPLPGVAEADDLTLRAAHTLAEAAGRSVPGVDIEVVKRLPLGGGLGGGSSDAATVLIALNRLWRLGLPRAVLMELALGLGADVPVFVFGRSSYAEGIGERLTPIALPPAWYLVLTPPVQVATAEIFADPELTRDTLPSKISGFSAGALCELGKNDLEACVVRRHPEVAAHLAWASRFGRARMTGSGACVFVPFATEEAARAAWAAKPAAYQGFLARGVDRHPLCDAFGG